MKTIIILVSMFMITGCSTAYIGRSSEWWHPVTGAYDHCLAYPGAWQSYGTLTILQSRQMIDNCRERLTAEGFVEVSNIRETR